MKELAAKEGVDPEDQGAVRRFDTKRPARRTSNEEWKNPLTAGQGGAHQGRSLRPDLQARGLTDLENGAIVQVEVLEGDHPDTKALSERVACAVEVVNRMSPTSAMAWCARSPQTQATSPSRKLPRSKSSIFAR